MSKTTKPTTTRREISPLMQQCSLAAYNIGTARRGYAEERAKIMDRLNLAVAAVSSAESYTDTITGKAGNMITAIDQLTSNMRLDLIVKYAGQIEASQAVVAALTPLLSESEQAEIATILEMYA